MELDASKIKIILAEKCMNQSDLALSCGLARQQINAALTRRTCSLKTLGRIAKALGVSVVDIVKEGCDNG